MARRAALPWDLILSAEVFRHYKPDPETYLGVCDVFDIEPARMMLVAAHHDDLAAARACGCRTAFVERPLEFGPKVASDTAPRAGNDLHARDFRDLRGNSAADPMDAPFDWSARYDSVRTPLFARNVGPPRSRSPRRPVCGCAAARRQCGRRGDRGGGRAHDRRAGVLRPGQRRVRNRLGRDRLHGLNAWGWRAGGGPRLVPSPPRRPDPDARLGSVTVLEPSRDGPRCTRGSARFAVRRPARAGNRTGERGFAVTPTVQREVGRAGAAVARDPGVRAAFLLHGRVPQVGERFVFADAARFAASPGRTGATSTKARSPRRSSRTRRRTPAR